MKSIESESRLLDTDLTRLVRNLGSRNASLRTAARYKLAEADAGTIERVLHALETRSATLQAIRTRAAGFLMLYQFLYLGNTVLRWVFGRHWDRTRWGDLYLWTSLAVALPAIAMHIYGWYSSKYAGRAVAQIACIDDKRVVPALIDTLGFAKGRIREAITAALEHRLPSITSADRALISLPNQRLLITELGKVTGGYYSLPFSPGFALAVIKALEAVGDEEAIPAIRAIAERPSTGSPLRPVIAEARTCLDMLIERQEQERDSRILLRATDTPGTVLLKPVGAAVADNSEAILLRPSPDGRVD